VYFKKTRRKRFDASAGLKEREKTTTTTTKTTTESI